MNIYLMKKPKRVNAVSVSLVLIGLVLVYAGYFLIPVYWPVFQLTGMMRGACNDAYRVHDNEPLMKKLMSDAKRTGLKLTKENFQMTRTSYEQAEILAISDGKSGGFREMVEKRGKECVLKMHYEDSYALPFTDQKIPFVFDREVRAPMDQIKWEKKCTCVTVPRDD